MQPIGNIIFQSLKRAGCAGQVQAALVIAEAEKILTTILGPSKKQQTQAVCIKNKILTIACLSSAAAQEIKLRETEILAALRQKKRNTIVEKLRIIQ